MPSCIMYCITLQIWDLAKCCAGAEGGLKLTLTGHIHSIRGLAISSRHPYLFSAGEDKLVKCTARIVLFNLQPNTLLLTQMLS